MFRSAFTLLLLAFLPAAAAADAITAEWNLQDGGSTYGSFGGASGVTARGQQFKATAAGHVLTASLRVGRSSDHEVGLMLSVYAAGVDGLPTGDPLTSAVFAAPLIPVNLNPATVFTFPGTGEPLEACREYVLVAAAADTSSEAGLYYLNGAANAAATYADGTSVFRLGQDWSVSSVTDWSFQVTVDGTSPVEAVTWGTLKARGWRRNERHRSGPAYQGPFSGA